MTTEFVKQCIEETPAIKADWRERNFWKRIPEDCRKAISELNRLKVSRLMATDYEETFADVWWLVLHEVDMYVEGEFCKEAYRSQYGIGDPQAMSYAQAKSADKWLVRWYELAHKYSTKGNFSEYHDKYIGWFGDDGIQEYYGQL